MRMRERERGGSFVVIVALLGIGGMLTYTIYGRHGLNEGMRLRRKHAEFQEQIAHLERTNRKLEAEIDALTHDSTYIEKYLRSTYGMVRKNEVVYQFVE